MILRVVPTCHIIYNHFLPLYPIFSRPESAQSPKAQSSDEDDDEDDDANKKKKPSKSGMSVPRNVLTVCAS